MLFIKSPSVTKSYNFVNEFDGIKFIENDYETILRQLSYLVKDDVKIKTSVDLTKYSWKYLQSWNVLLKLIWWVAWQ